MSNGRILMNPDELNSYADQAKAQGEEMLQLVASITNTMANIEAGWDGAASASYCRQYHELKPALEQCGQTVIACGTQLRSVVNAFLDSDTNIASQINAR